MVSGRCVSAGEVLGSVGNYGRRAGGTTTHLHFDAQVPTRAGWVFVNPYMTLVAAYERLVGGRSRIVNDAMFAPAPAMAESQTPASGGESTPNSAAIAAPKLAEASKSSASDDIVTSNIGESSPHP
jgi:hypothetical protein